jgi:hypothetical protein
MLRKLSVETALLNRRENLKPHTARQCLQASTPQPLMWIHGLHCNALYNPPTLTQFNALHELRIIEERSDNWFYEYLILRFSKPHQTYSDNDFGFAVLASLAVYKRKD